ncbi:MAG: GntR family transcriptional regulator [Anaerolineae bacterium]
MLDTKSPKPLYEQIKDYILHGIHSGTYKPNDRIPSERDLSDRFGVSRLTVNKAVKQLVRDGWLYVQIGKGTFINDEPIDQQLETLTSFTEEMTKRGQETSSKVLFAHIIEADTTLARQLLIPMGVAILRLQRVRLVAERPMALETSHVVATHCRDILDTHDFSRESLYSVLRQDYDISLTHAEQVFEARSASPQEAEALDLETGDPVLAISRVTFTANKQPLEYVQSVYRGDKYKFRAVLRRI